LYDLFCFCFCFLCSQVSAPTAAAFLARYMHDLSSRRSSYSTWDVERLRGRAQYLLDLVLLDHAMMLVRWEGARSAVTEAGSGRAGAKGRG
jgi:hypothetical protein